MNIRIKNIESELTGTLRVQVLADHGASLRA
jgi:hypothetical protein